MPWTRSCYKPPMTGNDTHDWEWFIPTINMVILGMVYDCFTYIRLRPMIWSRSWDMNNKALEEFQTHGDFWWIHGDFMWIKHGLLDNHPFNSMIYLLEKVFFHSYVQFPEATRKVKSFQLGLGLCPAMGGIVSNRCFLKSHVLMFDVVVC